MVQTLMLFTTNSPWLYLSSGVMLVTGSNSSLKRTVQGDESYPPVQQVLIEVDNDGDGTFETTLTTSWSSLTG